MTDTGEIPEDASEATLPVGARLGKYQISRLLGAGGMGAVYEAAHSEIGKRVAIKVLGPAVAAVPGARARFLREAQLTSQVRHPNIVDVTDMGNEGGQAFLVMELLRGEDLSQRLSRAGRMGAEELTEVMLPVCSAVAAAHKGGITHRDLKPQNIFLSVGPHGMQPKVLDFGISKGTDKVSSSTLTGTGAMIGTPYYLAPEQVVDGKSAGPASDQYALGVILYECLCGRRPYEGDNLFIVFQAIVNGAALSPTQLRIDLPGGLEHVVSRAMNVDPKRRFSSVEGLGRALLPFASARGRLLWNEAFAHAPDDADDLGFLQRPAGGGGSTIAMPVVGEPGIATGKVAPRGKRDRENAPLRPPGVTTLDIVSPDRHLVRAKKLLAVGGGAVAVGLLAIGLVVGRSGSKDPAADSSHANGAARPSEANDRPTTVTASAVGSPSREGPSAGARTSVDPPAAEAPPARREADAPLAEPARLPPKPVEPPEFNVAVATEPRSAVIELDGVREGTGKLRLSLPADHERHVLRVSAEGYEARVVAFTDEPPPSRIVLSAVPSAPRGTDDVVPSTSSSARRGGAARGGRRPREDAPESAPESASPTLNPNGAPVID